MAEVKALLVRMPAELKEKLDRIARESGLTLNQFMLRAIRRALKGKK